MENTTLRSEDLNLNLEDEEEVLDVLDLPQLYQKPSAKSLLTTLSLLRLEPRSWDCTPPLTSSTTPASVSGANTPVRKQRVRSEGVPQYLTRIISSPLAWLKDDDEKEIVWDAASVRLSERSGRTGMGAISRSFRIPLSSQPTNNTSTMQPVITSSHDEETIVDIKIHEPALTEDNLGLKTWASSFVLARQWHTLKDRLPALRSHTRDNDEGSQNSHPQILELGAGTGLVGIAAAAVLHASILLTDLPDIVPNLAHNISENLPAISSLRGNARAAILDWTVPEKIIYPPQYAEELAAQDDGRRRSLIAEPVSSKYKLVVAADPIYSTRHPEWLVQTVGHHLAEGEDARVVIIIPIREAYAAERKDFRDRMTSLGLVLDFEEIEIGYDDWSEGKGEELKEVECWITVWRRKNNDEKSE